MWPEGAGGCKITVDSVLGLRAGDDGEEACEIFEDITGWWLPNTTWGNDEAFIRSNPDIVWGGPTFASDYGTHAVADQWWASLTQTIGAANLVLLLVERLEGGMDKGHTHYLLVLGYEEQIRRRGGNVRKLWLKDPMEGDQLLEAEFWAEPKVELMTKQACGNGKPLDRYSILEATHLKAPPGNPGAPALAPAGAPAEAQITEVGAAVIVAADISAAATAPTSAEAHAEVGTVVKSR
jgi:hypothetical protein